MTKKEKQEFIESIQREIRESEERRKAAGDAMILDAFKRALSTDDMPVKHKVKQST